MRFLTTVATLAFISWSGLVLAQNSPEVANSASAQSNQPEAIVAQNVAQNVGVGDFQFNELDFDRQDGSSAAPVGTTQSTPGVVNQGLDNLTDLFSDQTQPVPASETNLNLPGQPSPVAVPAGQGEAKIELTGPAAAPAAQARPLARTASPKDEKQGNRFYWASRVWAEHSAVKGSDCQSYVTGRPLYHVRCVSAIAARNIP
ncbi:MAG: hypothetical protein LBT47_10025 [Deltaproteobacteria bacterium]|nr:hypothetical protein [Deltaproteobacteria bacterium]